MAISFHSIDIDYTLDNKEDIRSWIQQVIENKDFKVGEINYFFCSDEYILKNNRQFLSHNYTTDIITFDYTSKGLIAGDILISIPTVSMNAERYNVPFFQELLRVLIHGVLHLMGYKDKTDQEKNEMRAAENLSLLFFETNFR
ncbi:rRNA maturation RNase YbeY [Thermophagus sp. OGC60D27]|uniref:rRNA maturation RNase YbeY n=1 Tax=Thermophagus sp. OGC60D27 TaxID=3458415 RepID=UPI004037EA3B